MIIAIDPGIAVGSGVAIFDERGAEPQHELIRAFFVPAEDDFVKSARAIDTYVRAISSRYASCLVIEKPQIYTLGKGKGDPNGLLDLALLVGALVSLIPAIAFELPHPRAWKGNVPKPIHHARILEQLSPDERKQIEKRRGERTQGDILDAVGLGLWQAWRGKLRTRR